LASEASTQSQLSAFFQCISIEAAAVGGLFDFSSARHIAANIAKLPGLLKRPQY
jgi:hypothetical protein